MIAIGVHLPSRIHVFDLEVKCHINFNCKDDVILWLLGTRRGTARDRSTAELAGMVSIVCMYVCNLLLLV